MESNKTAAAELNRSRSSGTFPSKKKKLSDDYMVDGSIVKLELKNFMTFSDVKYSGNPKLNLIIGPNGSGKSSIVTALILGFGGGPKDINRGDKVSQFVKQGENMADITIELYQRSKTNIILRRKIFSNNDACHYLISNSLVSKKKYAEFVESLNIKVHNLCQFLPQDRLEDFSKLDSKNLFLNILQSIENQDLFDTFEKLKNLTDNLTTYDKDHKKLQHTITSEIAINTKLETIVSSYTEKKSLENQLLVILQKRSWSLYILVWTQCRSEMKRFDVAKNHNKIALDVIKKRKNLLDKKVNEKNEWKKIVLNNAKRVDEILEKLNDKVRAVECYVSDLIEQDKIFKKISIQIEDYKVSISTTQEKIEKIKNDELDIEEFRKKFDQIKLKISTIDKSIYPLKSNLESVKNKLKSLSEKIYAFDQEIEREKRKENSKYQLIQRNFPEIWKAINWLRNCDKSIFHGQVFEPMFTQIEVIDQKNAKYIENIINFRDMIAFFFEHAEDMTKFNKIVKQERWGKINSISAPSANIQVHETPNYNINSLKNFGLHSYALDMIKTHPLIRRYLAKNYNMHNIPIGSNDVNQFLKLLPVDINVLFAGNVQISIRVSSYSNEKIIRQTEISNEIQFLLFSVDINFMQSLVEKKKEVEGQCDHFEKQQTDLLNSINISENSRQPLFAEKKEIQSIFMRSENKHNAIDRMIKNIKFAESELKREEERSTKCLDKNLELLSKYFDLMKEIIKLLNNYSTNVRTLVASACIVENCCHINMNEDIKLLKELKSLYINHHQNLNEYIKYIQKLDEHLKKNKDVALYWTKGVSPYDKDLFKPIKEEFANIEADDVDDLDMLMVEKKAKLNCLTIDSNSPLLIKEYHTRKTKIKELEKKLEELNNNVQSNESRIERLHSEWLPKVKEVVEMVGTNFSKFFTSFGCKGLIELDTGVTRYDFHAYGLLIKVQFRNDGSSMRLLDVKSQSGGERALTTALFLLALQEVTHFPFRIVDEINQGMDKVYERKLMELFMDLFETRNNQYIVVTPKLIKNLSFNNTSVEILFCFDNKNEKTDDVD